jgi:hypothetical protein
LQGAVLPPGTIVGGRVARPIIIDGGTLTIDPAPTTMSPAVTLEQATALAKAAQTYASGASEAADIGFGVVDVATSLSNGLPSYRYRPAWVALWGPQTEASVSCPGSANGSPTPPTPTIQVVLIDSQTAGDVLDYRSRGSGPCAGQITGPSVQRAEENVSIPWTAVGETSVSQEQLHRIFPPTANLPKSAVSWMIRYTIPRCASVPATGVYDTAGTAHPVLYVQAQVPISPPSSCAPAKAVTQSFGPETVAINQVGHAPTGVGTRF